MSEIKSCPFCGGKTQWTHISKEIAQPEFPNAYWVLACHRKNNCTSFPSTHGDTKAEAVRKWNERREAGNYFVTLNGIPSQPIALDDNGVARFRVNPIVRLLLDSGPFDMNKLAHLSCSNEDREHFAQLIGYSVSGFGELSYVQRTSAMMADAIAGRLAGKGRSK